MLCTGIYTLPVHLRVFEDVQFYLLWVGVCQQGYQGAYADNCLPASCSVLILEDKQNLQLIKQSFTRCDINQDQFISGHCEAGGETDFLIQQDITGHFMSGIFL